MKRLNVALVALFLGSFGMGFASCGSLFDCRSVCQRYQDCWSKNYDVSACTASCKDKADKDPDFRRKADVCDACISGRDCAEATAKCTTDCVGIVP